VFIILFFFLSLNILWGGAYSIFEVLSRDLCDREGNDEINIHYYSSNSTLSVIYGPNERKPVWLCLKFY
jgi:hypothetical protein